MTTETDARDFAHAWGNSDEEDEHDDEEEEEDEDEEDEEDKGRADVCLDLLRVFEGDWILRLDWY